jgi:hypothetical protein
MNFAELLTLVGGGVTLHNALGYLSARLTGASNAVATADIATLQHDATGVVDYVQAHDPALAKAVEDERAKLTAEAEAEVAKVRASAAEELRKLAAAVEHASASVPLAPATPDAPVAAAAPGA